MLKSTLWRAVLLNCIVVFGATMNVATAIPTTKDTSILTALSHQTSTPTISLQAKVEVYAIDYMKKNSEMLDKIKLKRGGYFKTIDDIFERYGLPVELKYLAVIESKLKNTAVSKVGAVGMWQFMPATARLLGLKVTSTVDERTYPYKSTVAAAKYLRDLYREYGDWLLVIAAYNSGPGPVNKAIKKAGSRCFWDIQYFLPQETRLHVKKFIATHHYFEGEGSLVTLTKAETAKHLESIRQLAEKKKEEEQPGNSPHTAPVYFHWVAVVQNDDDMIVVVRK